MNFYLRATKREMMDEWTNSKRLKTLGIPYLYGFGSHVYNGERYRFLVLPRLGTDIHKMFLKHSKRFHLKTAFTLAYHVLDCLEYIHNCGYVHSDIKGLNIVLGDSCRMKAPIYLLDFGLVSRYIYRNGVHKEFTPDIRKAEIGTLEFSSRDAHVGAISRRSDLESLGFNLVRWLDGRLPWDSQLSNPDVVKSLKEKSMADIKGFVAKAFSMSQNKPPGVLGSYLEYVSGLEFESAPDYGYCKKLLCKGIRDAGFLDDNKLTFESHKRLTAKYKKLTECENIIQPKRKRLSPITNRRPCAVFNHNTQVTRAAARKLEERIGPRLRSHEEFNWALVLANNPEKHHHHIGKKARTQHHHHQILYTTSSALLPPIVPLTSAPINPIDSRQETGKGRRGEGKGEPPDSESLSNPTPAMIKVMQIKKKKRHSEPANTLTNRRSRNHNCKGTMSDGTILTPAMMDVIANRRRGLIKSEPPPSTATATTINTRTKSYGKRLRTNSSTPIHTSPLHITRTKRRRMLGSGN